MIEYNKTFTHFTHIDSSACVLNYRIHIFIKVSSTRENKLEPYQCIIWFLFHSERASGVCHQVSDHMDIKASINALEGVFQWSFSILVRTCLPSGPGTNLLMKLLHYWIGQIGHVTMDLLYIRFTYKTKDYQQGCSRQRWWFLFNPLSHGWATSLTYGGPLLKL